MAPAPARLSRFGPSSARGIAWRHVSRRVRTSLLPPSPCWSSPVVPPREAVTLALPRRRLAQAMDTNDNVSRRGCSPIAVPVRVSVCPCKDMGNGVDETIYRPNSNSVIRPTRDRHERFAGRLRLPLPLCPWSGPRLLVLLRGRGPCSGARATDRGSPAAPTPAGGDAAAHVRISPPLACRDHQLDLEPMLSLQRLHLLVALR